MSYEKVEHATALFIGMKQTVKAIEQGLVKEVFIAKDADYDSKNPSSNKIRMTLKH